MLHCKQALVRGEDGADLVSISLDNHQKRFSWLNLNLSVQVLQRLAIAPHSLVSRATVPLALPLRGSAFICNGGEINRKCPIL